MRLLTEKPSHLPDPPKGYVLVQGPLHVTLKDDHPSLLYSVLIRGRRREEEWVCGPIGNSRMVYAIQVDSQLYTDNFRPHITPTTHVF